MPQLVDDPSGQPISQVALSGSNKQQTLISVSSLAANGSTPTTVGSAGTFATITGYAKKISLTVSVAYGPAITAAPTVNVFTSPDGVAWDTDAYTSFSPSYAASLTKQKTVTIDSGASKYIGVQVINGDGTNALGAVKVTWQEVD